MSHKSPTFTATEVSSSQAPLALWAKFVLLLILSEASDGQRMEYVGIGVQHIGGYLDMSRDNAYTDLCLYLDIDIPRFL